MRRSRVCTPLHKISPYRHSAALWRALTQTFQASACVGTRSTATELPLQVARVPLPPPRRNSRGTVLVHSGFLATWAAPGIRDAILPLITSLASAAQKTGSRLRVLTCGHSLGGAVATLAAHDIVSGCGVAPEAISCYTFGCPRVGNRAFAAEWRAVVPDTWHIINNQARSALPICF